MKKLIKEEENTPQVTQSEVASWENKFRESVSSMVQFETDDKTGQNSLKLYKGISGVDASWSGIIVLKADNYIKWTFSIQNGLFIETKTELNDESLKIITNLYAFYGEWKQEWLKNLTMPQSAENNTEMQTGGEPMTESMRRRNLIINESSWRMKKLAGLH